MGRAIVVLSAHTVTIDFALIAVSNFAIATIMYLLVSKQQNAFHLGLTNDGVWRAGSIVFAPASFFLLSGYAESLSLVLTYLMFSDVMRSPRLKALVAGLSSVTSPIGLAATLIFLVYQFRGNSYLRFTKSRGLTTGAIALLPFSMWSVFLLWRFGNPLAWITAQQGWARSFTLPFVPMIQIMQQMKGEPWEILRNIANIGTLTFLFILIFILCRRPHEWRFRLYAFVFFIVSTSTMVHSEGVVYAEALFRHCFCNLWFLEAYWRFFRKHRRRLLLLSLILMSSTDYLLLLGYPMT